MTDAQRPAVTRNRTRSSSITQALKAIPLNEQRGDAALSPVTPSPVSGSFTSALADASAAELRARKPTQAPESSAAAKKAERKVTRAKLSKEDEERYKSYGFWSDLRTGKWMLIPKSCFPLLVLPWLVYFNHRYILTNPNLPNYLPTFLRTLLAQILGRANPTAPFSWSPLPPSTPNLMEPFLFLSGAVQKSAAGGMGKMGEGVALTGETMYKRDFKDLLFISYYIILFSFIRQSITMYFLAPLSRYLGISRGKTERFTEQGYAAIYFSFFGSLGCYVMSGLPIWWYNTSAFWTTFPVLEMPALLKAYYLLQFSYWLQQTIILAARVEKPRKDFKELVAHHVVTLWLIGWSYCLTLTYIGVGVFVTMDVSDIFLALAKCINYVSETASVPVFAFFVCVWTYMRHYLNLKMLWSVWYEFEMIPEHARSSFRPWLETEVMDWWIQPFIFGSIFALQIINLFWYFLILRILYRAVFGSQLADDRSDDEDEADVADDIQEVRDEKADLRAKAEKGL
ncbi:sphingosine N-acyltransferase lag1 [Naganishia albida]|nr:sphingosine N-acyltransferase lag1 [Naganishia albida]